MCFNEILSRFSGRNLALLWLASVGSSGHEPQWLAGGCGLATCCGWWVWALASPGTDTAAVYNVQGYLAQKATLPSWDPTVEHYGGSGVECGLLRRRT